MTLTADKLRFWGVDSFHKASPEEVADNQRRRLLLGITRAVASKGYGNANVADVLKEARVSRRTFYELFRDKEDCYLAAYEVAHNAIIAAIKQSQQQLRDPLQRIEAAHRSFLEFIQQQPEVAQAILVGAIEAGPRVAERRQQAYQQFADLHARLHQQCRRIMSLPEVPKTAFAALTAGTNILITDTLRSRGPARILELLPDILYLSYAVYGLHAQAAAQLR